MTKGSEIPGRFDKQVALMVSGGRTGTAFLGRYLSEMIPGSASFHEPDILDGFNLRTLRNVRRFGLYHMTIGRLLGRTGIRVISERFLSGELSAEDAARHLRRQRLAYYRRFEHDLVIEAYYQWYGLLPVIPRVFDSYRVAAIIRDPRTWVTSWLNEGGHHGRRDWVTKLGFRRLDPARLEDPRWSYAWQDFSPFQKLCWEWATVYGLIDEGARRDPNIQVFRYEELFGSERERAFEGLLRFITTYREKTFPYRVIPALLDRRVNVRRADRIPAWRQWPDGWVWSLEQLCGRLMRAYGYGQELEWKEHLNTVAG